MDIRKLQKIVVSALEDIKGKEIEVINTSKLTSMFDYVVIATGDSNRQVKALARNVHEKVWVLVDLGDIVVHVMQPTVRQYYNLEELWQTTPAQRRKAVEQAAAK